MSKQTKAGENYESEDECESGPARKGRLNSRLPGFPYIARALLQRAGLIILDESFAALDPESLRRALRCILNRAPTLLVIAHP